MKKNRIMSLMLSVMMLFAIVFPASVLSEEIEIQELGTEFEEIVVDLSDGFAVEEAQVDEIIELQEEEVPAVDSETEVTEIVAETVKEAIVSEEAALVAIEAESMPFEQGYVRVHGGTVVYDSESEQNELGSFSGDALVYATVSSRVADETYTWLQIVFDTAEAKEANGALLTGYVQFKDVAVLSGDEVDEQLNEALKDEYIVRSYGDKVLPVVSFMPKEEKITEEVVSEFIEEEVLVDEVYATSAAALSITRQPFDKTIDLNGTVSFSIETNDDGASYQWQYNPKTGNWKNSTGTGYNTNAMDVIGTKVRNGYQYRCVVTFSDGTTEISDVATLAVVEYMNKITGQPDNTTVEYDETATFTVETNDAGATYQWQYNPKTGNWKNSTGTGNKTASMDVIGTKTRNGYQYRCIVTFSNGTTETSYAATLTTVEPAKKITGQPADATVEYDETATFTVETNDAGATYQWQYNPKTGNWKNSTGAGNNTPSMDVVGTLARDGYQYRCIVTFSNGTTETSYEATLSVLNQFVVDDVTYEIVASNKLSVAGYSGTSTSLTIPEKVNGITVTEIGEEAFAYNTLLAEIDLPDTITIIRARAFKGCTNLSSMK